MATVTEVLTRATVDGCDRHSVSWTPLNTTDTTGRAFDVGGSQVESIVFTGNFSGSASLTIQGSNDGTNWATLPNIAGTAIAHTAAGISGIGAQTRYVRPILSSGDGSAAVTAVLLLRKNR